MPSCPPAQLAAFLFDMDGVLIDNSPYYHAAWRRFTAEYRHLLPPGCENLRILGRRNSELLAEVFGARVDAERIPALGRRLEDIYLELYLPHMTAMPGLRELLAAAAARGVRFALATSAPQRNVPIVLARLGLERTFANIFTEEDVRRGKPDPEVYLRSAAAMGQAPEHCLVFEDSLAGVTAARAAGCLCAALRTSYEDAALRAAGADLLIDDFADTALWAWLEWASAAGAASAPG